jgi:fructose-1-phosphate kinase PfkB-like protein
VVCAPKVKYICTSGTGDSMVAGMAMAIARGDTPIVAARFGVAAGTAANSLRARRCVGKRMSPVCFR